MAVRCVMTTAASHFVTPLSVASLSGDKVYSSLFSLTDESEMGHIELSRQADLIVVVPATANMVAKMANGIANDLASTVTYGNRQTGYDRSIDECSNVGKSIYTAQHSSIGRGWSSGVGTGARRYGVWRIWLWTSG